MKALVFAAGLGTRLRPLTDHLPKALVDVGGVPVIQRVLLNVRSSGITDVVVNVHHFPDMIRDFLSSNNNFGLNIQISDETDLLLDTGGGLNKALSIFGEDEAVLLHNADIVTDLPLSDMISRYDACRPDALLLTSDRNSSRRLLFNDDEMMQGWLNAKTGEVKPMRLAIDKLRPLAFGGVHIVDPRLFPALREYGEKKGPVFSITSFYIDICSSFNIRSYIAPASAKWYDIGRPESLAMARRSFEPGASKCDSTE